MSRQSLQIVFDSDAWGSSRVESGQAAVFQRNFVVEFD